MVRINPMALSAARWIATAAGISGAILVALNLGVVAHGFALFLVASMLWVGVGLINANRALWCCRRLYSLSWTCWASSVGRFDFMELARAAPEPMMRRSP